MGKIWDALDKSIAAKPVIPRPVSQNLYPSEARAKVGQVIYGKCMRASFLRIKGAGNEEVTNDAGEVFVPGEEEFRPTTLWIFRSGNIYEDTIIDEARSAGILAQGHARFKILVAPGAYVSGEIDAIFRDPANECVGIEIKSVHGHFAESSVIGTPASRKRGHKGSPKVEHLMQTAIYTWHFRDQLKCFYLLYIMRDKCLRAEFKV